ncbi:MAG TPA: response regulator [Lacibacter sp.]|nr:response regulator [Lacibacter sp.]HMO88292.1 response regulator [Lacibacter sp.]
MKTILLIEDNADIRENTSEILELAGYKVFTAENGKLGLEQAMAHKPDLIICDIMMPVLDGYGVLHVLQKNDELRFVPFIFLSAKSERTDLRKGMEMGADDYITKPFTETELLSAIESRLRKTEMLQQEMPGGLEGWSRMVESVTGKDPLAALREDRNVNKYKKKQVVYSEGNHPGRLYYILKGKVKTFKTNDDGKELTIGLYNQGDFLGYIPLLENEPYKETAEAMEDSELAIIPRSDFEELLNNNREVSQRLIRLLANNITEKENQLLGLAYNSLRKRVAEALLTLMKKYKEPGKEKFAIHISREDLANIAATATESLIRTLSDFRSEKLIDIKEGNIVILNEKKLQDMIN